MAISQVNFIRRVNLSEMLRALHTTGPLSRSELGGRLGLTRSTTSLLAADLVGRGLAIESQGLRLGTPGRPSPVLRPNETGVAVLAAQIAVNFMVVALVGLGGRVLGFRRVERDPARFGPQDTVHDLRAMLADLLAGDQVSPDCQIAGIGVGVCGVVRSADGHVVVAPNIGWRDVPLASLLAPLRTPRLPLHIVNDLDAAVIGEHVRGIGAGVANLAYVGGEIGIGAGILIDGRLLRGASTSVGEVGHWPVNPRGRACRCGAIGCWETEVGGEALLRAAGVPLERPYPPIVERVIEAARRGECGARDAVAEVGGWIGMGLAGVTSTFGPQMIVLSGLFADLLPLVFDQIRGIVRARNMLPDEAQPVIAASPLGVRSVVLGIAELAFEPLLENPISLDLEPLTSLGVGAMPFAAGRHGSGFDDSGRPVRDGYGQ